MSILQSKQEKRSRNRSWFKPIYQGNTVRNEEKIENAKTNVNNKMGSKFDLIYVRSEFEQRIFPNKIIFDLSLRKDRVILNSGTNYKVVQRSQPHKIRDLKKNFDPIEPM